MKQKGRQRYPLITTYIADAGISLPAPTHIVPASMTFTRYASPSRIGWQPNMTFKGEQAQRVLIAYKENQHWADSTTCFIAMFLSLGLEEWLRRVFRIRAAKSPECKLDR